MNNRFYDFCVSAVTIITKLIFRFKGENTHILPEEGPVIICANHISAIDPVAIAVLSKRRVHFMAKAELFKKGFLQWFFSNLGAFPVDRGNSDMAAIRQSLKVLAQNEVLGIFPQGTRSADNSRTPMAGGVSMLALRSKAVVIPVYISKKLSFFGKAKITFGQAVDLSDFNGKINSENLLLATKRIEDAVWAMKDA